MKAYDNLVRLLAWWRENPQPATITALVKAGLITAGDASHTMQYGMRHGVVERLEREGSRPSERAVYQWTGKPLPPPGPDRQPIRDRVTGPDTLRPATGPSFDALLTAWGIALNPPRLPPADLPRHRPLGD